MCGYLFRPARLGSLVTATAVAALITVGSPARAADAADGAPTSAAPRSKGVAYALALGGTLAPMYVAKAITESGDGVGTPVEARLAIVAGLCVGPSLGYGYARSWRYAVVSATIKSAMLGSAMYADERSDPMGQGHGWLTAAAAVVAAGWTIGDIIHLGAVVDRNNDTAAAAGRAIAFAPLLGEGRGVTGGLAVAGRF